MSWRTGALLFIEMWPLIQTCIEDCEERIEFTANSLKAFMWGDVDPYDIEDIDAEIRAAMRLANIGLCRAGTMAARP